MERWSIDLNHSYWVGGYGKSRFGDVAESYGIIDKETDFISRPTQGYINTDLRNHLYTPHQAAHRLSPTPTDAAQTGSSLPTEPLSSA